MKITVDKGVTTFDSFFGPISVCMGDEIISMELDDGTTLQKQMGLWAITICCKEASSLKRVMSSQNFFELIQRLSKENQQEVIFNLHLISSYI